MVEINAADGLPPCFAFRQASIQVPGTAGVFNFAPFPDQTDPAAGIQRNFGRMGEPAKIIGEREAV